MSPRDLVVLGTSSAVPTRTRNHNGYLLRWDGHGVLFDPGEGTQRQLTLAGVGAHDVTWICVSHFHGDHCLGVPGVIQRMSRDAVTHPVTAAFPAGGAEYWRRLRYATPSHDGRVVIAEHPVTGAVASIDTADAPFALTARRLSHSIEAYGYLLREPDDVTMLPDALSAHGIAGPAVGELRRRGAVTAPDGRTVTLGECSVARPGQKVAFVMDTRLCDAVYALADGVDLLVIESTFLGEEARMAEERGHLTAAQAGRVAAECGVRRLVLTHFSQRYGPGDEPRFLAEAGTAFGGDTVLARDLDRIDVPARRRSG